MPIKTYKSVETLLVLLQLAAHHSLTVNNSVHPARGGFVGGQQEALRTQQAETLREVVVAGRK